MLTPFSHRIFPMVEQNDIRTIRQSGESEEKKDKRSGIRHVRQIFNIITGDQAPKQSGRKVLG